jgi:4-methoxybenzoate monooxygenase (O-demethylating)
MAHIDRIDGPAGAPIPRDGIDRADGIHRHAALSRPRRRRYRRVEGKVEGKDGLMGSERASGVDPYCDEFLAEPWDDLALLRAAGPAVWLERYDIWAIARHDDVMAALRDHEAFSSSHGVGLADLAVGEPWRRPSILVEADPPEHTRNRKVVAGTMTPKALRSLEGAFADAAQRVVDELLDRRTFDGVHDLAEPFPTEVFPRAFGIEVADETRQRLLEYGSLVFNGNGVENDRFRAAVANAAETIAWVTATCARDALRPDGIGAAIHDAAEAAGLSPDDGAMLVRSFLSAGVDTTVSGISFALRNLAADPGQWELLRGDPGLTRNAFEETIRRECPVIGFFRMTTRPTSVGDVEIPAGRKALIFYAGANRDPSRWDDPDRYDIRRRVSGHLGYGIGIHTCVGMVIARMEGDAVLGALRARVRSLDITAPPVPRLNNSLRGLDSLPLALEPA